MANIVESYLLYYCEKSLFLKRIKEIWRKKNEESYWNFLKLELLHGHKISVTTRKYLKNNKFTVVQKKNNEDYFTLPRERIK